MRFLRFLFLIVVLLGAAFFYYAYLPFGPSSETFVDIPTGTGSSEMASRLESAGVIRSRYLFLAMRKVHGGTLHAGEYRFDHAAPIAEVYGRILRGDVYTRTLVIPEGFNLFDIAQAVQNAGLGTAPAFMEAAYRDTHLIADMSPGATSLEGFLFPDTYRFSRHTGADGMLAAMVKRFRQVGAQTSLMDSKRKFGHDSKNFANGEKANELVSGGTSAANPGVAALKAALNPARTDYLYFVADASGNTRFSVDLKEHAEQVQAYREAEKLKQ